MDFMATRTRRRRSRYSFRPRWLTLKRTVALAITAVLFIVGLYGVRTAVALGKVFHTDPVSAVVNLVHGGGGSKIQGDVANLKRINIALYGYGGPGHDGPYLTDSIMVVSLQPEADRTVRVAEISVPRDWYVPIELGNGKRGFDRVNQAYSSGMDGSGPVPSDQPGAGASVANPTLSRMLGLQIDYFVGIDFSAFKSAVDAVGGVDVNVPTSFTDSEYPAGECVNGGDCSYRRVHFDSGIQHMDGATALVFSRSRHGSDGEGSDFARSKRQQLITAAVKQKLLSVGGIGQLPDLLNALGDHVKTDLTINDAEAVYALVKNIDPASVVHISLDDQNFLYECGYPGNCDSAVIYAHDSTYQELKHFDESIFVDSSLTGNGVHIAIKDGSGTGNGASTRWTAIFGQLGWHLDDQGPVRRTTTTKVIDGSAGAAPGVAKWFADYFGVPVTAPSAAPASASGKATPGSGISPTVTIILGADEEHAFNNAPGWGH